VHVFKQSSAMKTHKGNSNMKTRTGNLFQRKPGGAYYVKVYVDKKPIVKSLGTSNRRDAERRKAEFMAPYVTGDQVETLKAVQAKLADRETELAKWEDENNPPPELNAIWHRFLESPARPDSGESTLKQYHAEWKRFKEWLRKNHPAAKQKTEDGKEPPLYLRDVTQELAAAYAKDLTAAKVSPSTFNQHRNLLRMIWRVLAKDCRLTANPWNDIHPRKLNALATRKRALTQTQFETLLLKAEGEPDLHDLFTVLAWTGLRLADAVLMKWGAVDFPQKVITLAPIKTARRQGKQVHIPLFPAVLDVLNRRQEGQVLNPKGFVFPELATKYEHDTSAVSKDITKIFEKAGIQTTEERADRENSVIVYGAHSLRHFFVTQATAAGMPAAMIKSITGHATDGMLEHYQQIGADLAADLATRIQGTDPALLADALPEPTDAAGGNLEALRGRILELAEQLDGKNWLKIKAELEKLSQD
jgi:integrase